MGQVLEAQIVETQILETDEQGRLIIPAELLGDAKPHERFVVRTTGRSVTAQPEAAAVEDKDQKQTPDEWMQEWRQLAEDVGKAWQSDKSALEELTEMRNARG